MPLYELFSIARSGLSKDELSNLMKRVSLHIIRQQGVISDIQFAGEKNLPYRIRTEGQYQYSGNYWSIQFYGKPEIVKSVKYFLRTENLVIRNGVIKLNENVLSEAL